MTAAYILMENLALARIAMPFGLDDSMVRRTNLTLFLIQKLVVKLSSKYDTRCKDCNNWKAFI